MGKITWIADTKFRRKVAAVLVIVATCIVVASGPIWLALLFVPLVYFNGYLHGRLDEGEAHLATLEKHIEFVKSLRANLMASTMPPPSKDNVH